MKNLLNLKERSIKRILLLASRLVTNRSPEGLKKIVALIGLLASRKDKKFFRRIRDNLSEENPQFQLYRRILVESNPNFRNKIITNLLIQGAVLNQKKREIASKEGFQVPATILISPTMRCNLSCIGCYAGIYTRSDDLEFEVIDHPEVSRGLYKNCKIYPTHEGAECLFSDIAKGLDEYAKGVRDIYTEVWTKEKELFCKKITP